MKLEFWFKTEEIDWKYIEVDISDNSLENESKNARKMLKEAKELLDQ